MRTATHYGTADVMTSLEQALSQIPSFSLVHEHLFTSAQPSFNRLRNMVAAQLLTLQPASLKTIYPNRIKFV